MPASASMPDAADTDHLALHEAAHAVVSIVLGEQISYVTIIADDAIAGASGTVLPADYSPKAYPALAENNIVGCLAGIAAEQQLTGTFDLAGARLDLEEAFATADEIGTDLPGVLVRRCQERARELVAEHWQAIEAVAAALKREPSGTLLRADLDRIIGGER